MTSSKLFNIMHLYRSSDISIEPNLALSYKGDFIGLLINLGIDRRLLQLTMKLNGVSCSTAYTGDILTLQTVSLDIFNATA